MARLLLVSALLFASSAAFAQRENTGCTRDASRHCRAVLNNGDMAVLACLKQHRSQLSHACSKTLTDNGQ